MFPFLYKPGGALPQRSSLFDLVYPTQVIGQAGSIRIVYDYGKIAALGI